jgi:hypothetical protein
MRPKLERSDFTKYDWIRNKTGVNFDNKINIRSTYRVKFHRWEATTVECHSDRRALNFMRLTPSLGLGGVNRDRWCTFLPKWSSSAALEESRYLPPTVTVAQDRLFASTLPFVRNVHVPWNSHEADVLQRRLINWFWPRGLPRGRAGRLRLYWPWGHKELRFPIYRLSCLLCYPYILLS